LIATLSVPIVGAALEGPPEFPAYQPREAPALEIMAIDRFPGIGGPDLPRSEEPFAGVAFVRCTRLWVSEPDGSNARRLLPMTGVDAPAFSPDGRTIAFIHTEGDEQSLWLAAADGSQTRRLDTFSVEEAPVPARVSALAWSGSGEEFAFALTDGTHGPLEGGSAIWTLDLSSGKLDRLGGGLPAPVYFGDRLMFGSNDGAPDLQLTTLKGNRLERLMSSSDDDLAAATVPQGWWMNGRNGVAILRSHDGELRLAIRNLFNSRDRAFVKPPSGYRYVRTSQPVITQDASRVAIDLLDPGAGRDLGLLDTVTEKWTVLDYAWDPSASPTPTIVGPLSAREAKYTAESLFSNWGRRPGRSQMLTAGDVPMSLLPWKHMGWLVGDPERMKNGWSVPSMAYSYGLNDALGYREINVLVRRSHGRLTATPTSPGPLMEVTSLEDAHGFAEAALGRELPNLPPLPEGTRLADDYALNAMSWRGMSATINTVAPRVGGRGPSGGTDMSFSYGDRLDFSLGCGGAVDPQPTEVAGIPAMIDHSGSTRQVIWPATPERPTGTLSVHGILSKEELLELAEAVENG
jgi:hypothetical protein